MWKKVKKDHLSQVLSEELILLQKDVTGNIHFGYSHTKGSNGYWNQLFFCISKNQKFFLGLSKSDNFSVILTEKIMEQSKSFKHHWYHWLHL